MFSRLLPVVLLLALGLVGYFLVSSNGITNTTATASRGQHASNIASNVDEYLSAYVDQGRFSGAVLIARGDDVLVRKGYNQADREHDVPNTTSPTRARRSSASAR